MKTRYKFLRLDRKTIKSDSGNLKWKINEWVKCDGKLDMCNVGLHCSKSIYDAFSYVQGEIVAKVEVRGKSIIEDNKECWSEMRIIEAKKWGKKDSLRLAIFSAELVLKNFEKEYPDDKRPREAIEAAKKVLFKDTAKNRAAAESAWYATGSAAGSAWYAARSAEYAAGSAAESATRSAEYAAGSAAWYAARSAEYATRSAEYAAWSAEYATRSAEYATEYATRSAARSAARSAEYAAIKKIQLFMNKQYKTLEEYK